MRPVLTCRSASKKALGEDALGASSSATPKPPDKGNEVHRTSGYRQIADLTLVVAMDFSAAGPARGAWACSSPHFSQRGLTAGEASSKCRLGSFPGHRQRISLDEGRINPLPEAGCAARLLDYALSGSSAAAGGGEEGVGKLPLVAPGIRRRHRDLDAPNAGGNERADLEQA